jgi:hypothetical protein
MKKIVRPPETRRFSVNEGGYIIDSSNPANSGKAYNHGPDDEMHLRESLLWARLGDLVDNLIINTNPIEKSPYTGEEYQPPCQERSPIQCALHVLITASHLNTLYPLLSLEYRFSGKLSRDKTGWREETSLALFVDDVERLLRDLYGESDTQAIDRLREAVLTITLQITQYCRNDLYEEHMDAERIDLYFDPPEDDCFSISDLCRRASSGDKLLVRARAVLANPAGYSKYTVEFMNLLNNRKAAAESEKLKADPDSQKDESLH